MRNKLKLKEYKQMPGHTANEKLKRFFSDIVDMGEGAWEERIENAFQFFYAYADFDEEFALNYIRENIEVN